MGRNLSPIVRRELANLDKDADSRKSAMKVLKSYVKDLDSKTIPQFLAQVSETKETVSSSGEYTISLYEVLARAHGANIVPQIDNIMTSIVKTLSSSAGSFALHQACSKVVPAIARYGIDLKTPGDKKRHIIHSLCKPLSDSLLGSQESLSSGAALCLGALVDSDNWKFASNEMVNEVCLRVAGTLEDKPKHTNSHMGLVMALAKRNGLVIEAYARLLILSGLRILNAGVVDGNPPKCFSAIQMVNFLMRCLDPRCISSEVPLIIKEMDKFKSNQIAYVQGAAFEALQTARMIAMAERLKFDKDGDSNTEISFGRGDNSRRRNLCGTRERATVSVTPESQTLESFMDYDILADLPIPREQVSCDLDYDLRSVTHKRWGIENGLVDTSLRDLETYSGSPISSSLSEHSEREELASIVGDCTDGVSGFLRGNSRNGVLRSGTSNPQDPNADSDFSQKQTRRLQDPSSSQHEWHPTTQFDQNGFSYESVSSADGVPDANGSHEVDPTSKIEAPNLGTERTSWKKSTFSMVFRLTVVLLAVFAALCWIDDQEDGLHLAPT